MTLPLDIDTLVLSIINFAAIGLLGWFLKKWVATKLEARSQRQLEELKATLRQENEVALARLRDRLKEDTRLQLSAHASFAAAHEAAVERRLESAATLWTDLLRFRGSLPPILTYMDMLTAEEYPGALEHPTGAELIRNLSEEGAIALAGIESPDPIEGMRPFVDEHLWQLSSRYRAIQLRIVLHLVWSRDKNSDIYWYRNPYTRQLIEDSLSIDELEEFDNLRLGKISYVAKKIEDRILDGLRRMISGENSGSESFQQARRLQSLAQSELFEPPDRSERTGGSIQIEACPQ